MISVWEAFVQPLEGEFLLGRQNRYPCSAMIRTTFQRPRQDLRPQRTKGIQDSFGRDIETNHCKKSPTCKQRYDFALFFIKSCPDIEKYAGKAAGKMNDDGILWFAYPKKSSKKYETDLSRDQGWQPLGDLGYEGVRQVAKVRFGFDM